MSEMQVGASLLAQVEVTTLDKLLASLKSSYDSAGINCTRIAPIDLLLEKIVEPRSLLEHLDTAPSSTLLADDGDVPQVDNPEAASSVFTERHSLKRQPAVIEISASEAKAEASDLCYLLTAAAILAKPENGTPGCVVWLDTEARFSVPRLYQREHKVREALKHVHVFTIHSSKQLLSILHTLPAYFLGAASDVTVETALPEHYSSHRCLSLIMLDSATAFYWPDRFDTEIAQLEAVGSSRPRPTSETYASRVLTQFKSLNTMFDCSIVYTTDTSTIQLQARQPSNHNTSTIGNLSYPNNQNIQNSSTILPPPPPPPETISLPTLSQWTTSSNLSLHLSKIPAPQFASHMSIEDCLRDRDKRTEIVRSNRVTVSVNKVWLDRVVRDADVKTALKAMNAKGGFVMQCTDRGVDIESLDRSYKQCPIKNQVQHTY